MGTLVCRVELNKEKGIILTVENGDADIAQTIIMDGTTITSTVQGSGGTSSITQDQDSITVKCKDFIVAAETVTCESSEKTTINSGDDLELESQANLNVKAANDASYEARNTTVKSQAKTEVQGFDLNLVADKGADLTAAMVTVDASGTLDLSAAGITTLKGSIIKMG